MEYPEFTKLIEIYILKDFIKFKIRTGIITNEYNSKLNDLLPEEVASVVVASVNTRVILSDGSQRDILIDI